MTNDEVLRQIYDFVSQNSYFQRRKPKLPKSVLYKCPGATMGLL